MINSAPLRKITVFFFISTCIYTLYRAVILHHTATYLDVLFTFTHSFWFCTIIATTTTKNYKYGVTLITISSGLIILTINNIDSTIAFMGEPSFEYLFKDIVNINYWQITSGLPNDVFSLLSTSEIYQMTMKVEFVTVMTLLLIGTLKERKIHKYVKINKKVSKSH